MTLDKSKLALALSGTFGILYVICGIFVFLLPDLALRLMSSVAHMVNVAKFAGDVKITLGGLLIGLIQILIYGYVAGWIFGWLYNRLSGGKK